MMSSNRKQYIISVQRALLDCLTNNMNAITIGCKEDKFILRVYFEDQPDEDEVEVLSDITSEVAADFPNLKNIEEEYFVLNTNKTNLEILDVWIIKKA